MKDNSNLFEILNQFGIFFRKNTSKIVLLLLLITVVFGVLYKTTKTYYKYELTLSSKQLSKGDLNLMIEKIGTFVENKDTCLWTESFRDTALAVVKSIEVEKKYGSEHENSIVIANIFDTTKAAVVEQEILYFLNSSPEVIRLNEIHRSLRQELDSLKSLRVTSTLEFNPALEAEIDSLRKDVAEEVPYTVLTGFIDGERVPAGPKLSRYIEWGAFSFFVLCAGLFGFFVFTAKN